MNRFNLLLFLCLTTSGLCYSQTYNWRWARGSTSNVPFDPIAEGEQVATDSLENLFVCGFYDSTISFGSYSLNERQGSFIAKYDSSGNIKWAKGDSSLPSSHAACDGLGVCTDAFGNCYVCGGFRDSIFFDTCRLIGSQYGSSFLVKYDSTGNALWARSCGDAQDAFSNSCAVDQAGNIYITGSWGYGPSVTFGSQTLVNLNGNSYNVFLVKYDSSGNVIWARTSESLGLGNEGMAVKTDIHGNVYLTGFFDTSSISFGTDTLLNINSSNRDLFLVKYDSSGNVLWAQRSGGQGYDAGWDVACDLQGNVFLVASIDIPYSGVISKYDSLGNLLWSKNIASNSNGQIFCYRVTTDIKSNVYVTGGFNLTPADIGGDTILQQPSSASDPLFIVKYDPSGHFLFAKAVSNGGDDFCGIAVTNSGSIYLGGDYTATSFIVGNDTLSYPGTGYGEQIFTAKLICKSILAGFISNNYRFCGQPACVNFLDNSMGNPISWKWLFPGAIPDSSLQQNPMNICYPNAGNFDVTLIVSNGNEVDTLTLSNYITVYPNPVFSGIIQTGDSLFTLPGFINYQWYQDTTLISGANNFYYVATHSGDYSIYVTDTNGCNASATLIHVIASMNEIENKGSDLSINYNYGALSIRSTEASSADIKITDALGKIIYLNKFNIQSDLTTIDLPSKISTGIYFISLSTSKEVLVRKIFVE